MPRVDVVIVGGGVTGLLVLRGAIAAGYSAILFESESLAGGQTGHSQAYLIHGHLYALSASEPGTGARTAVFGVHDQGGADTPFRQGAHAWSEILRELEITAVGNAYHLVPQRRRSRTLEAWEAADLEFTHVSRKGRPLPLVAQDPVYRSDETFVPDITHLLERLRRQPGRRGDAAGKGAAPLAYWIRKGKVTAFDPPTGRVTVALPEGGDRVVDAAALVVACPDGPVTSLRPKLLDNKVIAVFARGPDVPDFALVFRPMMTYRSSGSTLERARTVMAVPRVSPSASPDRAWLCSTLVETDATDWRRSLATAARLVCGMPESQPFGFYEERVWSAFDADTAYQVQTDGTAIGVYPVRLTLAPLAAADVCVRLRLLVGSPSTPGPEPPDWLPGVCPDVAEERWLRESTYAVDALP